MRKLTVILIILFCLLSTDILTLEAAAPKRNQYEDTVGEAIWDWVTTLGKSPKEKKIIKQKRRIRRAKERANKKAKVERARLEKENKAREIKVQKIRDARIRARRREIERAKKSQRRD